MFGRIQVLPMAIQKTLKFLSDKIRIPNDIFNLLGIGFIGL